MFINYLDYLVFGIENHISGLLLFIKNLSILGFIFYFWPFILDFTRYFLLNLSLLFIYAPKYILSKARRERAKLNLYKERPLISVLVPGKNEGKSISILAEELIKQTYKNIELIVVDDGSDDETEIICRQLEKQGKIKQFIRNSVRGGKASAANTALYYAQGKYIIHIDADSYLENNSIETILLPFYMNDKIGAVGGDIRVRNVFDSIATRLQSIEYIKSISGGRTVAAMFGVLRLISGAHGAFRRDILMRLKGWDTGPGLDGDITLKIRKLGYQVAHEPHAVCFTRAPVEFKQLAKQRYRWDRSLIRFRLRKHVDILLASKGFSFLNFLTSLDSILFNFILNFRWLIYIFILILSGIAFHKNLFFILITVYLIYFIFNVVRFTMVSIVLGKAIRENYFHMLLYLPLMPFYTGLFLRLVRIYAIIMELFFKESYNDNWNPWKVSKVAKKEGL